MLYRHPTSDKRVLNKVIGMDDYGNALFKCTYTGKTVALQDAIYIGPCVPQVNGTFVCAPDAMPAFRSSKKLFDEMDANCNTCKHLERAPGAYRGGFLRGYCGANITSEQMQFHPEDHMGMTCWEGRT